jgi:hypothetical protein
MPRRRLLPCFQDSPSTGGGSCRTADRRQGPERVAGAAGRATVAAVPVGETASSRDPVRTVGRRGADAEGARGPVRAVIVKNFEKFILLLFLDFTHVHLFNLLEI